MLQNRIYVNQDQPAPDETEFRNCNFSRPSPDFDGEGNPVLVRIWPNDDTPRRLIDCNCTNCRFGPNVELIGCAHVIAEYGVALGGDIEIEIDDEWVTVPRTGTRAYGKWDPTARQPELFDTPAEINDIVGVMA